MQKNIFKIKFQNYWRNIDKNILISFLILFFLGLFFSFSSTSSLAGERLNKDYYFFFSKHLIFTFIAFIIMILISVIDTPLLKKFIIPSFVASFILLVLVPLIGVEVKGSKRWLDFYFLRLQPIEVLKPFFILASVKILISNYFINQSTRSWTINFVSSMLVSHSIYFRSKLTIYFLFYFYLYNYNEFFTFFYARKIWLHNKSLNNFP